VRTAPYTAAAVGKAIRETIADWLMLIGALVLLGSLFLTWSHQFSPAFYSEWGGSSALVGVPRDPTAWQVYSVVDVLLAVTAGALLAVALQGGRTARCLTLLALAIALAFVVHAISNPPTSGANLLGAATQGPGYTPNMPRAGTGETAAIAALGIGIAGLMLSLTVD
jgi:hypothetical protein